MPNLWTVPYNLFYKLGNGKYLLYCPKLLITFTSIHHWRMMDLLTLLKHLLSTSNLVETFNVFERSLALKLVKSVEEHACSTKQTEAISVFQKKKSRFFTHYSQTAANKYRKILIHNLWAMLHYLGKIFSEKNISRLSCPFNSLQTFLMKRIVCFICLIKLVIVLLFYQWFWSICSSNKYILYDIHFCYTAFMVIAASLNTNLLDSFPKKSFRHLFTFAFFTSKLQFYIFFLRFCSSLHFRFIHFKLN